MYNFVCLTDADECKNQKSYVEEKTNNVVEIDYVCCDPTDCNPDIFG